MNSEKDKNQQIEIKSNEVDVEKLSPAQNGKDTDINSNLERKAPAESPKVPEQEIENQSAGQDSPLSSKNPLQPESPKNQSGEEEQGSVAKPSEAVQTGQPFVRKGTGPRTAQGKQRSRLNAAKHRLLFKDVLLPGESRSEYDALLDGLWDYWQPQGTMEYVEVEKLAAVLWRESRLSQIEKAEILKNMELSKYKLIMRLYIDPFDRWQDKCISEGLLTHCNNPLVLLEAKETLMQLRTMAITEGFAEGSTIIKQLYGEDPSRFRCRFSAYLKEAKVAETYGDKPGERECSKIRVAFVDAEIERLNEQEKIIEAIWHKPFTAIIPDEEQCNLLWRYETHFDRLKDRIVKRLERLQRMRKGQPLPLQLDVNIS